MIEITKKYKTIMHLNCFAEIMKNIHIHNNTIFLYIEYNKLKDYAKQFSSTACLNKRN